MNLKVSFVSFLLFVFANKTRAAFKSLLCENVNIVSEITSMSKAAIPEISRDNRKGAAGKIVVIGGSVEYTGAPYFAAISALKVGADLVDVITTEDAAPVIKSYSPDLVVHPIRNIHSLSKIKALLRKAHVAVIGPGLGREPDDLELVYEIIRTCKSLKKALVIDADALYAIAKNVSILKDYPSPGAILTPNHVEAEQLKDAILYHIHNDKWFDYWGTYVTVLEKGEKDACHSSVVWKDWWISDSGSGRRAGGQGDILAGSLATFFHWALQSNLCKNYSADVAQRVAAYSAAKITRTCNFKAYTKFGRSMTASDMINEIHSSFTELFDH